MSKGRQQLRVVWALTTRALNEILRVPGAAVPGILAPSIFMIGIAGVFGEVTRLPGFSSDDYHAFILPVGLLQGAGFAGAATGVNLARDIEQGWFDRMLLAPVSRTTLLLGTILSAAFRSLLPSTVLILLGFALGVPWPGALGLVIIVGLFTTMAATGACWGAFIALRARTQQAAPMMQVVVFAGTLCTSAYAPLALITGWLKPVAEINPVTQVLEGLRQGFVTDVTWTTTWQAFAAAFGMAIVLGLLALLGMRRFSN